MSDDEIMDLVASAFGAGFAMGKSRPELPQPDGQTLLTIAREYLLLVAAQPANASGPSGAGSEG